MLAQVAQYSILNHFIYIDIDWSMLSLSTYCAILMTMLLVLRIPVLTFFIFVFILKISFVADFIISL